MGFSPGVFHDDQGRQWHLESSSGLVIVQNPGEMAPAMRLTPEQAVIMHRHLSLLLQMDWPELC